MGWKIENTEYILSFPPEEKEEYKEYETQLSTTYISFLVELVCEKEKYIKEEIKNLIIYEKRLKYNIYKFLHVFEEKLKK